MLPQQWWWTLDFRSGVGKTPHRTNGLEGTGGRMVDLLHDVQLLHLGMSEEGGIIREGHRVSAEFMDQAHDFLVAHLFKRLLPDGLHFSGIAANTGGFAAESGKTRVVDVLFQPQRNHQSVPILAAAATQAEEYLPGFGLVAVVWGFGIVVE